jgi:hypothetical protein
MSGELELVEKDAEKENETERTKELLQASINGFQTDEGIRGLVRNKIDRPARSPELRSTAEGVKVKLETQIKSILRNTSRISTNNLNGNLTNSSMLLKRNESFYSNTTPVMRSQSAASGKSDRNRGTETAAETKTAQNLSSRVQTGRHKSAIKRSELFKQVNSHSFKDIDLIKIEPRIEPTELKDPVASAQAKIPVVKTRYTVNVLKKPYSMKWLRNRRLVLFLQSELYNEFKLGMILAQLAKFNKEYCKTVLLV